ncbi:hypothetical protein, partial [Mycobacterium sp.]|uniref:DNA polymerase III subunit beta family protein n=1 Tax=Mycobacterium sp. TaxID=1785 RepID=UPI003A8524EA
MDTKIEDTSLTNTKIFETGRVLVKANLLNDIVQKMEGQYVTFTKLDSNLLTIEDADSNYKISLLDADNYETPTYQTEFDQVVEIPAVALKRAINRVSFAGFEYHTKFIFQGINLIINNGKLSVAACDGIKIASYSVDVNSDARINKIIPLKVARELVKLLPDTDTYTFKTTNSMCTISSENMINQFRLIEGTFPMFDKHFSLERYNKELTVDKEVLMNAIDKVSILTRSTETKISFSISNESFIIESNSESDAESVKV